MDQAYLTAWRQKMVEIWTDRLDLMAVYHTGALRKSLRALPLSTTEQEATITFQFLQYGIYVDRGVGRGYRPGNGGNLHFLDKAYRRQHHLGQARQPRPWYSRSLYISTEVLKNHLARTLGHDFVGLFAQLTDTP